MKFSFPNIISWIVSVVFHPILFTTLSTAILLLYIPEYAFFRNEVKASYLLMIFVYTYAIPILAIPLYFLVIKLSKIEVDTKHIRLFLLLTTCIIYTFAYKSVKEYSFFPIVNLNILYITFLMCVSLIITYFWKISLHMIGVGGFLGLLFSLLFFRNIYLENLLQISVLTTGVIAYSRMFLKSHNITQIYTGFLLSFVSSIGFWYFML